MKDVLEIFYLFIGVALVALLVSHSSGTAQVLTAGSSAFGNLLNIVENPGGSSSFGDFGNGFSFGN
jgi:hypothetical protein